MGDDSAPPWTGRTIASANRPGIFCALPELGFALLRELVESGERDAVVVKLDR